MIENGMIVNQEAYDPQCREMDLVRCSRCGDDVPVCDTETIRGKTICYDCIREYCDEQYPDLGTKYIEENEKEYLDSIGTTADDENLFYNWWLYGLCKTDRLRILKDAYQREKIANGMGYYHNIERDFCVNSDDWQDFVKSN